MLNSTALVIKTEELEVLWKAYHIDVGQYETDATFASLVKGYVLRKLIVANQKLVAKGS